MVRMEPGTETVCGGGATVHWLGELVTDDYCRHWCTVAVDVRTGRTWTTELLDYWTGTTPVLATSRDGELSMVTAVSKSELGWQIQVWVLADKWILR